jgi:HEPN domain-containing protein
MAGTAKATKTAPTKKNLQDLARLRLKEANALFDAGLYDGCVYLAGYAVELALKARICRVLKIATYPAEGFGSSYKVPSLDQLKVLAALNPDIDVTKNEKLFENWSIAVKWDPEQRYEPPGTYDKTAAKDILDSIQSKPNGVLTWLTKRW